MASTIASLFGPSAEQIVYDRQKEERDRKSLQYQQTLTGLRDTPGAATGYALGYQSGQGLRSAFRGFQSGEGTQGKILGGLFGQSEQLEDPRLAKSIQSRQIMSDVGIEDLNDAGQLSILAQRFSKAGMPEAALYFSDRVKELKKYNLELNKLGTITPVKDFVLADGTPVGQDGYGQWRTLNGEPVSVSQLVTEKTYLAGATAGTKDVTAGAESDIELTLLSDIDLKKEDKEALARRIEQEADKILGKKGNKLTREQARKNAFENLKETGVLRKTDIGLYPLVKGAVGLDTDLPYFQDWQYVPEGTGTVLKPGFRIVAEE